MTKELSSPQLNISASLVECSYEIQITGLTLLNVVWNVTDHMKFVL